MDHWVKEIAKKPSYYLVRQTDPTFKFYSWLLGLLQEVLDSYKTNKSEGIDLETLGIIELRIESFD